MGKDMDNPRFSAGNRVSNYGFGKYFNKLKTTREERYRYFNFVEGGNSNSNLKI